MGLGPALGPLVSFAAYTFDDRKTTEPIGYKVEWLTTYAPGPGDFPLDLRGLSAAPHKEPTATWKYLLLAPPGLAPAEAAGAVDEALSALIGALEADYPYTGSYISGAPALSGQVGDLVAWRGGLRERVRCFARIESLDVQAKAGRPFSLEVPLTFKLLSEWQAVP